MWQIQIQMPLSQETGKGDCKRCQLASTFQILLYLFLINKQTNRNLESSTDERR